MTQILAFPGVNLDDRIKRLELLHSCKVGQRLAATIAAEAELLGCPTAAIAADKALEAFRAVAVELAETRPPEVD